jgi:hypothetical protein
MDGHHTPLSVASHLNRLLAIVLSAKYLDRLKHTTRGPHAKDPGEEFLLLYLPNREEEGD